MLLDLYETHQRWNLQYDLGDEALNVDEKVALVLDRIKTLDPDRYSYTTERAEEFWNETLMDDNIDIPDLPDSGVVKLPGADCRMVQLAYQQEPEVPSDKRYTIKKEIWEMLDKDSQAALILHELLYREGIDKEHKTSRKIRYFLAHLVGNAVSANARQDYVRLLDLVDLPAVYTFHRVPFAMATMEFDSNGSPTKAVTFFESRISAKYQLLDLPKGTEVTFYPNGDFASLKTRDAIRPSFGEQLWELGPNCGLSVSSTSPHGAQMIDFYPEGGNARYKRLAFYGGGLGSIPECYSPGGTSSMEDNYAKYFFNPF